MNDNLSIIKILVSNGADPLICDLGGLNCYHIACEKGKADSLRLLLDLVDNSDNENKNILTIKDRIGWTPLSWACHKSHADCCKHLLKYQNKYQINDNNYIQQAFSLLKDRDLKADLSDILFCNK